MTYKTIDQIAIGDHAEQTVLIEASKIEVFGEITNDVNPVHFNEEYAQKTIFKHRIAHGMYIGSLFSKVFGMQLPGEGTIYISQSLRFKRPVYIDDTITAKVIVTDKNEERNRVFFDCVATNQHGEVVITGTAEMMPPNKEMDQ